MDNIEACDDYSDYAAPGLAERGHVLIGETGELAMSAESEIHADRGFAVGGRRGKVSVL